VVSYVVDSVSTWTDAAAGNVLRPQLTFKFKLDGNDVVFPNPATASELIPGFVGSPSAYFVFAVPQDGKTAPADFNASASAYVRNIWNGSGTCSNAAATTTRTGAGTLTGPDAMGLYTIRLTCATIPANATDADRRHRLHLCAGLAAEPGQSGSRLHQQHDAAHADRPARLSRTSRTRRRTAPRRDTGGVGGLIVPPPDVSKVATGLHGPARDRRQQQVRRVPRVAGRRARLPRRPAQRRGDVQLVSPPEPDEQRLVGQRQGLRPRDPRRGEAHDAVQLARGVAQRGLLGR
jgi:hypothetical protein